MNFGASAKFSKSLGFEKIESVVREELMEVGFGVLTGINDKELASLRCLILIVDFFFIY